ncbi:MAG: hypothetical protein EPN47_12645 [Acidobacteria bacterium]|nr:MAG: hypothetical protein EPN47_12645 [Acidobacteriota bacterium]
MTLTYPRDIFGQRTGTFDQHPGAGWTGWDVYWSQVAGQRLNMGGASAFIDHSGLAQRRFLSLRRDRFGRTARCIVRSDALTEATRSSGGVARGRVGGFIFWRTPLSSRGPRGMKTSKCLSLRENADPTRQAYAPAADASTSQILQKLECRTALFVLKNLKENPTHRWCRKMLKQVGLPASVHHHAHFRVWQRRGYDLNVWSSKKIDEKLDYMHNNPVTRKLVDQPGDWPWSSWGFYFLKDTSLLPMDPIL